MNERKRALVADFGDCGQVFRLIADGIPVIAEGGSPRRLQGLTRQVFRSHANRPLRWAKFNVLPAK